MNYELALALKNAGFRQPTIPPGKGDYIFNDSPSNDVADGSDLTYAPTLEELIESCGEDYFTLSGRGDDWLASYGGTLPQRQFDVRGKTKEEAIAKLWLTLNKKDPQQS